MLQPFRDAEEIAADDMDQATFAALITLHGAMVNHLVATARPLPRMLNFQFYEPLPSLVIAYRLYERRRRAPTSCGPRTRWCIRRSACRPARRFRPDAMPKPQETRGAHRQRRQVRRLGIGVRCRSAGPIRSLDFRFTAAERDPDVRADRTTFPLWQQLQFKPGDACTVELAGMQAVNGCDRECARSPTTPPATA